jgi:hypothetical protein
LFLSLIFEDNPQFRNELNEKREDLLKRLTSVKVVSKDRDISEEEIQEMEEIRNRLKNRLPRLREGTEIPIHAYIEPHYVPKGRISLIKALDFIGKHAKNPEEYDAKTIAKQHSLKEEEVKDVLDYFKPFYRDPNISEDPVEDTERVLGIPKKQFERITSFLKPKSQIEREQIEGSSHPKSQKANE